MRVFSAIVFLSLLFVSSSAWSSAQEQRMDERGQRLFAPRSYQDSLELFKGFDRPSGREKQVAHELSHVQQQDLYGFVASTKTQLRQAEQDYKTQERYVDNLKRYGVSENSTELVQAKRGANLRWQILQSYKGNLISRDNYPYQDVLDDEDLNDYRNYRGQ